MTFSRSMRTPLAGWLLLAMIILTIAASLSDLVSPLIPGVLIWISAILLLPNVRHTQLWQIVTLMGIGSIGLAVGEFRGANPDFMLRAIGGNQMITAMLLAVSFLRLIALANIDTSTPLPHGRQSLIKTLLGVHMLATVMNLSAVMIVGDRLATVQPVNRTQNFTLLRGFSACAMWSPFFAAMGVTLVGVPGAHLATLITYGLPAAALILAITIWQLKHTPAAEACNGYPITVSALWMPVTLAVIVMLAHVIYPDVPVLTLVTLLSLLFTLGWILWRERGAGVKRLHGHVRKGIPNMAGEVLLFLAAAVLASGAAAALESFHIRLVPDHFGLIAAWVTLSILIVLAIAGMHPVTTVALAASILAPHVEDSNLLALTFLFSWGLGVCLSPFSGIQLTLQSRYFVRARDLARMNWVTLLPMIIVAYGALYIYTLIHHIH